MQGIQSIQNSIMSKIVINMVGTVQQKKKKNKSVIIPVNEMVSCCQLQQK